MAAWSSATTICNGGLADGSGVTTPASGAFGATVDFVPGEGVKSSHIIVRGQVPGIDQETFAAVAAAAGQDCPISAALKGNIDITVEATLDA